MTDAGEWSVIQSYRFILFALFVFLLYHTLIEDSSLSIKPRLKRFGRIIWRSTHDLKILEEKRKQEEEQIRTLQFEVDRGWRKTKAGGHWKWSRRKKVALATDEHRASKSTTQRESFGSVNSDIFMDESEDNTTIRSEDSKASASSFRPFLLTSERKARRSVAEARMSLIRQVEQQFKRKSSVTKDTTHSSTYSSTSKKTDDKKKSAKIIESGRFDEGKEAMKQWKITKFEDMMDKRKPSSVKKKKGGTSSKRKKKGVSSRKKKGISSQNKKGISSQNKKGISSQNKKRKSSVRKKKTGVSSKKKKTPKTSSHKKNKTGTSSQRKKKETKKEKDDDKRED